MEGSFEELVDENLEESSEEKFEKIKKENLEKLEAWYQSIDGFEELSLKEAQKLLYESTIDVDITNKTIIRNRVVCGTMHYIYKFIKKSGLLYLKSSAYDIDDIIMSYQEVFIRLIDDGTILRVKYISELFRNPFYNSIVSNLLGCESQLTDSSILFECDMIDIMHWFFCENSCYDVCYSTFLEHMKSKCKYNFLDQDYERLFYLLKSVYDNNQVDELSLNMNLSKLRISYLLQLLLYNALFDEVSSLTEIECDTDISEEIVDSIFYKEARQIIHNDVFNNDILKDEYKRILYYRFGVDGKCRSLSEVGQLLGYGPARENIRQKQENALRKMKLYYKRFPNQKLDCYE